MSKKVNKRQSTQSGKKKITKPTKKKKGSPKISLLKIKKGSNKSKTTISSIDKQLTIGFTNLRKAKVKEEKQHPRRKEPSVIPFGNKTQSRHIQPPRPAIPRDKYRRFHEAWLINKSNDVIVKNLIDDLVRVYSMCLQKVTELKDRKVELREYFTDYYDVHLQRIKQDYSTVLLFVPGEKKLAKEKISHLNAKVDEIKKYKTDRIHYLYQEFDRKDYFSLKTLNRWNPDEEMYMLEYGVKHVLYGLQNEIQSRIIDIELSEKNKSLCGFPMIDADDSVIDQLAQGMVDKKLIHATVIQLASIFKGGRVDYPLLYRENVYQFCYMICLLNRKNKISKEYFKRIDKHILSQFQFEKETIPKTFGSYRARVNEIISNEKYSTWMKDMNEVLEPLFPDLEFVKPKE